MAMPISSEPLGRIRDAARLLVERAGKQNDHLESLVATADTDMRQAESALSALNLAIPSVEQLRQGLRAQLQRRIDRAHTARELLLCAREQHVAAARLLSQVESQRRGVLPFPAQAAAISVLVVDDAENVRELLCRVLRNAGFVVQTAANGLEALIAAYESKPAVILMDVTMPVLDGVEATRLIKAIDSTRQTRVIAHTGTPTPTAVIDDALFAAVLAKPATPDVVVAAVRRAAGL